MNLPFMSETDMLSSLIWRSLRMTSLWRKNISPSRLYHLSKYSLTIFLGSSSLAFSMSFLVPHLSLMTRWRSAAFLSCSFFNSSAAFFLNRVLSFFFRSGVMNPFFLAMVRWWCHGTCCCCCCCCCTSTEPIAPSHSQHLPPIVCVCDQDFF